METDVSVVDGLYSTVLCSEFPSCCMAVTSNYFEKIYSFAFWNVEVG